MISNPKHVGITYHCAATVYRTAKNAELEFLNNQWGLGRIRVGIELSYRPARLQRLAELIPWNRFLGCLQKRLKLRAQYTIHGDAYSH
jgi:hypothetical protein